MPSGGGLYARKLLGLMYVGGVAVTSRGGSRLAGPAGGVGAVTVAFSCRNASRFTSELGVVACMNSR